MEETNDMVETRARNIDDLALHDEMMMGILGSVKQDLALGLTSEEIMKKYSGIAAARIVSIAATEADSGKALAAAKDLMDRVHGKARETKDVTHRLDKVNEREIDAILLTELEALEVSSEESED